MDDLEKQVNLYKDTLDISEYGLYECKFLFDLPQQYKIELEGNYQRQKSMIASGNAAKCYNQWTVNGSVIEGRKMTKQFTKLLLYAFNGECDGLIAKVKWNNVSKTKLRILQTFNNINKLGTTQNILITKEYLDVKLDELALAYEYEQKKYEEKEEQRKIREQMREEERAQKEFERAQKEAEDEERRYQKALEKAKWDLQAAGQAEAVALHEHITALEQKLLQSQQRKERNFDGTVNKNRTHLYYIKHRFFW